MLIAYEQVSVHVAGRADARTAEDHDDSIGRSHYGEEDEY